MSEMNLFSQALDIVKAQAALRPMTVEEITDMTQKLVKGLSAPAVELDDAESGVSSYGTGKNSIRKNKVICLVCGQSFKILTKKHLASHGLTPVEYRAKFGIKKGTPLTCDTLKKARKDKMAEMKLWERRRGATPAPAPEAALPAGE